MNKETNIEELRACTADLENDINEMQIVIDEQARLIEKLGEALINEFGDGKHGYEYQIKEYKEWRKKQEQNVSNTG